MPCNDRSTTTLFPARAARYGALRAALYNPSLADCWQVFGAQLRYHTQLPRELSELAILAHDDKR